VAGASGPVRRADRQRLAHRRPHHALLVENYLAAEASLGGAGADEIRWPYPVRPGDTLRVRATVVESRRSLSKPDRGIIKTLAETANQDGRTVIRCTAINFPRGRPAPGA
jgi:acyl dehydratase